MNVDTIAVDGVVNAAEKAAGFAIAGDTAGQEGVTVAVEIGSGSLTASSDSSGAWSVDVPPASSYISEPSVTVTVNAAKTGFAAAAAVERTVRVDLTAPSVSYTAPSSLKVGVAMTSIRPTTSATDVESYTAAGLPGGLEIDGGTGAISGTPTTAAAAASTATVTVTDTAGNEAEVTVEFPAVSKGDLTLTGFGYSAESARVGQTAPAVTAPTVGPAGVSPTLSYAASPAAVCTVDAGTGALTLLGAGECEITVTAAATANYNGATDTATVTVEAALRLIVNVDTIAVDDVVNAAEKTAGFAIAGDTAGQEGVTVAVEIGSGSLTASSDSSGERGPCDGAAGVVVHQRAERDGDGERGEDGFRGGGGGGADGAGGPDGAIGELHGAVIVEGGGGDDVDPSDDQCDGRRVVHGCGAAWGS